MWRSLPFFVVVLLASVVLLALASTRFHGPSELDVSNRPIAVREHGYVSSNACRTCHPDQYDSWRASYHSTMTQVVGPTTVVADFDTVELQAEDTTYRLLRRGDEFWVQTVVALQESGERRVHERRVVLSTGSHHQQVYWMATGLGRTLEVLPFAWVIADQRWVPLDAVFLRPERNPVPPAEWNLNCLRCHSTHPQPRLLGNDFTAVDTHVGDFGISCEECHGPGEAHVARNQAPARRYASHLGDDPDTSIVQPENLSHRLSSQVCARCHAVTLRDDAETEHWNTRGFRYRPGDELGATQTIVQRHDTEALALLPDEPRFLDSKFWPDGMTRVTGREYNGLLRTPCFERGTMSCLSCHEMHPGRDDPRSLEQWADDLLKPLDRNESCTQCHEKLVGDKALTAHTRHVPASTGSDCLNCHMPHTSYGLLKAVRSHEIDVPSVRPSLEAGRPNACNLCHLDRTLAWTSRQLAEWYGQPEPLFDDTQQSVAAAVAWLLGGDAGQRALIAWHMGWEPARDVSGTDWMAPYLGQLLSDPYDAVRYIAHRSLRRLDIDIEYDFVGPAASRRVASGNVLRAWLTRPDAARSPNATVLVGSDGGLLLDTYMSLLRQRDDRPVALAE